MAATLWKNRVVSGRYLVCLFITTQHSNCGQWDWYTCVFTVQHSRATVDNATGTRVYLPCNTAEQLWTVGLVHVCIYHATQSNCGQWDWYMCSYCATQQSNFGQWYWYTCVYLACTTETVDNGTGTHLCIYHAKPQLSVVLTHVCIYCATEQLWTALLMVRLFMT